MASKDTEVQELIINTLTQEQFNEAKEAGTLSPYELYGTPDTSARLPVLTPMWFEYIANDVSWLRSDTFSWQSGDVYVAAYNHLMADFDSKQGATWYSWGYTEDHYTFYTLSAAPAVGDLAFAVDGENIVSVVKITAYTPETEDGSVATITLDGIAFYSRGELLEVKPFVDFAYDPNVSAYAYVLYYLAEDGHKICLPDQESNVSEMYEATGAADYYILDTTNKQFKLPRNYQPKRILIRTANNADGTWYKLYSDGWVEQGGYDSTDFNTRTWTYPIAMSDKNYTLTLSVGYVNINAQNGKFGVTSRTPTGFSYKVISLGGNAVGDNMSWRVEGYSSVQGGGVQRKYEYYYVGNFEQDSVEQTAGVTTETLNSKADVDLSNMNASQSAKDTIVGWGMPDYSAGVALTQNTTISAPSDGYITVETANTANAYKNSIMVYIDNVMAAKVVANYSSLGTATTVPVGKGQRIKIETTASSVGALTFYPCKGVN